jgi:hypothetical protein
MRSAIWEKREESSWLRDILPIVAATGESAKGRQAKAEGRIMSKMTAEPYQQREPDAMP